MNTKLIKLLTLFIGTSTLAFGFSLDGLSDKITEKESPESESSFDLKSVQSSMTSAFDSASPQVKSAVKDLFSSYAEKNDLNIFGPIKTLQGAQLSSDQIALWNRVKTDMMAAVLQRNFSFSELRQTELFNQSLSALKSGDLESLKSSYSNLKSKTSLTSKQKTLFSKVIQYAEPVKDKTAEGIKSLFGG